jgi:SAM-dependent methyltransferase
MTQNNLASRIVDSYDEIARHYVVQALGGVYTDYYERPAMYALLGDVSGQQVLDAGCAAGHHAAWLVAHGAQVLALDASPRMVALARERLGDAAEVRLADLNEPLDFVASGTLDTVLASLVLDYVRDWDSLFCEFNRVLVPAGRLLFSVHHPFFLDLKVDPRIESYFDVQQMEEDWLPFGLTIPSYRRPLSAMSAALWQAGFAIEQIVEPQPSEACRRDYPGAYERLSKHPVFLCFGARKVRALPGD